MADSSVSNFAPEFQPLIAPLVGGALEAYNRPVNQAVPGLTPQQQGALNWTNTLTTRPIDTTPMRNLVAQGTRPTMQIDPSQYRQGLGVATGAFNTAAGMQAANPYDELVRKRAMEDFDQQASQASARRAAQQIGTRGLNTKTGLGNAQFSRDMERQRGDLNSQLLQRGFETGRQQFNVDQARALQAAMANQQDNRSGRALGLQAQMANQQTQGRDRALSLQGANQLQGLENFERQAMLQNAGALQNTGSMVAGQQQALYDYPWNQVNRLRSVLSGTGQQTSQASAPWWQTAASLAGTGTQLYNTGIFSNLFGSGASAAQPALDIANAMFADGGIIDDEDEPRGAFAFDDEDEEDPAADPVAEQPNAIDADYWEMGATEEEPEGGGSDAPVIAEQGEGFAPPAQGALAPPAAAQGALPAPAGLAARLPTSGYTQAQLMAALEAAKPRASGQQTSAGMDALSALLLGIGGANTRDFGRALAAGGQNMTATLNARKRDDMLREQARQKAAALEAKTISDQMGKDRDIQGKALTTEYVQSETGKREMAKLEAAEKQGALSRENALRLGEMRTKAQLATANIGASATRYAADRRASAEGGPTALQRDLAAAGLKPGSPEYNEAIMQAHAPNNMIVEADGKGGFTFRQGKGMQPSGMGQKAQGEIEEGLLAATKDVGDLTRITEAFDPKFLQIPQQAIMGTANVADKMGMNLPPQVANDLDRYSSFRRDVAERTAQIRNKLFGAALTAAEKKSADEFLPTTSDGPREFKAKLDRTMETAKAAVARLNYIRKSGIEMDKVPLTDMPRLMNERGSAIFNELKAAGKNDTDAMVEAKRRVAQEFGLVGN